MNVPDRKKADITLLWNVSGKYLTWLEGSHLDDHPDYIVMGKQTIVFDLRARKAQLNEEAAAKVEEMLAALQRKATEERAQLEELRQYYLALPAPEGE
jgi:hypothetical protein